MQVFFHGSPFSYLFIFTNKHRAKVSQSESFHRKFFCKNKELILETMKMKIFNFLSIGSMICKILPQKLQSFLTMKILFLYENNYQKGETYAFFLT